MTWTWGTSRLVFGAISIESHATLDLLSMAFAGFGHVGNAGSKNVKERVATWTDLLIAVAMGGYVIALVAR